MTNVFQSKQMTVGLVNDFEGHIWSYLHFWLIFKYLLLLGDHDHILNFSPPFLYFWLRYVSFKVICKLVDEWEKEEEKREKRVLV